MQISTTFATYFPARVCPSLLNLGRKNVKPNIDFHLVHLNCIQLFQVSTERNQNQTANSSFSLFPLWAVILLYKEVCKTSIFVRIIWLTFLSWTLCYSLYGVINIYHLTSFTCACLACLHVRFWLIVCENSRVKLWRLVPISRIKALKLKQASFLFFQY